MAESLTCRLYFQRVNKGTYLDLRNNWEIVGIVPSYCAKYWRCSRPVYIEHHIIADIWYSVRPIILR